MLRDVQRQFMRGLLDGKSVAGIHPPAALAIYENNARANFSQTLTRTYPAVRRLVGDDYFRQCVREYQRLYPSRSGDLQHVGERFSDYLSTLHGADQLSYLADVALLEWAYQEALTEAELPPLDMTRFAAVEPRRYADLRFRMQPSARLVESSFPLLTIWQANSVASDPVTQDLIDLDAGAERLLLVRTLNEVRIRRLELDEYALLSGFRAHMAFEPIIESVSDLYPAFDPGASLQKWLALHVIVDFYL